MEEPSAQKNRKEEIKQTLRERLASMPPEQVAAAGRRMISTVKLSKHYEELSNKALGLEIMDKIWGECSIGTEREAIISEVIYRLITPWWRKLWDGIAGR